MANKLYQGFLSEQPGRILGIGKQMRGVSKYLTKANINGKLSFISIETRTLKFCFSQLVVKYTTNERELNHYYG